MRTQNVPLVEWIDPELEPAGGLSAVQTELKQS